MHKMKDVLFTEKEKVKSDNKVTLENGEMRDSDKVKQARRRHIMTEGK